ncbi:pitrilysin family protein [Ferrovibrio sp.]|uniref:M16 family metallopeptidase n=1 Tax=Ferrovibrio sp. TaxID=1917215 RepID=UPI0025C30489|nr:pitrilysin family protein [Ferrovibrio sp.]MBX3454624.1 insulinase family protein [Ferrovibrio sp.]
MKQALRVFFLLVLLLPGIAFAGPRIERVTSASGIEAWLVREPKIPMLALQAMWRGGTASDPEGQQGRAALAADLLTEGAGDLDAEAFQSALRDGAISLDFDASRDYLSLSLRVLNDQRQRAFDLLAQALTAPRFDDEPIARVKAQAEAAARRALNNPGSMVNRRFLATAFPNHAYGRESSPTLESLPNLQRADFAAYSRAVLARKNLVIGVVGDISPDELRKLLDASFGKLPAESSLVQPPVIVPKTTAKPLIVSYDNPQSMVVFGGPGLLRDDPDYYVATVLNYVLGGGGFNSRLTEEIREKRGLVYSVGTQLHPMLSAGLFMGSLSTRNDQAGQALALVREAFARIAQEGITDQELADAKAYLTGSFPLRLTSNGAIAGMLAAMQASNLGPDYIDRYAEYIEAVRIEDIRRVAQRLFASGDLLVVVVGKPAGIDG